MKNYIKLVTVIFVIGIILVIEGTVPHNVVAAKPLLIQQGDVFIQVRNQKVWQVERSRKFSDPEDVKEYLKELNQGKHSDWRLPTKSELSRLFDIFDVKRNGDVQVELEGYYWIVDDGGNLYPATWKLGEG